MDTFFTVNISILINSFHYTKVISSFDVRRVFHRACIDSTNVVSLAANEDLFQSQGDTHNHYASFILDGIRTQPSCLFVKINVNDVVCYLASVLLDKAMHVLNVPVNSICAEKVHWQ